MTEAEVQKVQNYLRDKFGNDNFRLVDRIKSTDSVEVYLAEEFIGTLYRVDEEDEVSYAFTMSILEIDLPQ
ncbi:MAG: DUF3126 family protein [Pseudomonadota bacterium]|nr:DUF3126 family protein [Pseudomonadota bacterium]